jgi:hypothetical protein
MTATCPHQDCQGLCFGQEIRDNEGNVIAVEYFCQNCGATWREGK